MFLCFWHGEVMLASSGLRHFPSDFCAVPDLHVFAVCASSLWNWLVAAWICHWDLPRLGLERLQLIFENAVLCPHTPSNVTPGLEMMWFDVSRSSGTEVSFWEKVKTISTPLAVLEQRMKRSEIKMPLTMIVNIYRALPEEIGDNIRNCPATA